MRALERGPERAITDDDEAHRVARPLHRPVRLDGERDVLFRREATDVDGEPSAYIHSVDQGARGRD